MFNNYILLTTKTVVKSLLEIPSTETINDSLLDVFIAFNSNRIETFLNRNLLKKERTEYFSSGRRLFYVSAFPIDSTATLTVSYSDSALTENEDYYVWYDEGVIEFFTEFTETRPKEVSITYTGGFSSLETLTVTGFATVFDVVGVPPIISIACARQTAFDFMRRRDTGIVSLNTRDGSFSTLFVDLLPDVKQALLPFRRTPVGR
ncbi:MAG TPA: hypothetical protein PLU14_00295 [Caldisericia bacterium]|nr:hypothetical protein [Caldisericia bacterium]